MLDLNFMTPFFLGGGIGGDFCLNTSLKAGRKGSSSVWPERDQLCRHLCVQPSQGFLSRQGQVKMNPAADPFSCSPNPSQLRKGRGRAPSPPRPTTRRTSGRSVPPPHHPAVPMW